MIRNFTFSDCTSLKQITIPDSVTYVNSSAFDRCILLKKIILKSGAIIDHKIFLILFQTLIKSPFVNKIKKIT